MAKLDRPRVSDTEGAILPDCTIQRSIRPLASRGALGATTFCHRPERSRL